MRFNRIILIVLDSVGAGELPDSEKFNDKGADTLGSIDKLTGLTVPNLEKLGLGTIKNFKTVKPCFIQGAYATKMMEKSQGKDTITGHWEFMGTILEKGFPVYLNGFPKDLMDLFERETGYGYLGNYPASGTVIIEELGEQHIKTKKPIVYTSADSVFQIAAHEDVIPLNELYRICEITRNKVTIGEHQVSRVIARPFTTVNGKFKRTKNRKDYALTPPKPNVLDLLFEKGIKTGAIGKIEDMFVKRGISHSIHSHNNQEAFEDTVTMMETTVDTGFIFANFVDFDMLYGHRRNVEGYRKALEDFDKNLKILMEQHLNEKDLLIITADHGCDPAFKGSDHTREYVPLLVYSKSLQEHGNLEIRKQFSDIGITVLDNFGIDNNLQGKSFLGELK
jgi:phosphopentomutase